MSTRGHNLYTTTTDIWDCRMRWDARQLAAGHHHESRLPERLRRRHRVRVACALAYRRRPALRATARSRPAPASQRLSLSRRHFGCFEWPRWKLREWDARAVRVSGAERCTARGPLLRARRGRHRTRTDRLELFIGFFLLFCHQLLTALVYYSSSSNLWVWPARRWLCASFPPVRVTHFKPDQNGAFDSLSKHWLIRINVNGL